MLPQSCKLRRVEYIHYKSFLHVFSPADISSVNTSLVTMLHTRTQEKW